MNTYLFSIHKRWNDLIFIELIKKAKAMAEQWGGELLHSLASDI